MASLKRDEMTPTEKALQNRIKEAFAFKIPASLWECIIESLEITDLKESTNNNKKIYIIVGQSKGKNYLHTNSYNEYYNVQKENYAQKDSNQDFFVY